MKKNIIKFYSTYKLYIFPAIVGLSGIFLIVFAIYPQTAKLISNQKKSEDLMSRYIILSDKVSALESYNQEDLAEKMKAVLNVFPREQDFADAFTVLPQLISGSGFIVTSISLENSSDDGSVNSFGMRMDLSGNMNFFQNLLNNLEYSPRLLKINSIDISSNPASGATSVSLGLQVLYASIPADAGTPDSPLPALSQKDEDLLGKLKQINIVLPKSALTSPRGKINPFE